jgi:hypothetical protein
LDDGRGIGARRGVEVELDFLKEWGGWIAAAVFGWFGMRDGRINELIDLRVSPDEIHKALERIEGTVNAIDSKTDQLTERVARLEGSFERQ